MSSSLTPFGRAIRDFRMERHLLLHDMSQALGLSSSELSGIEMGRRAIPTDMIDRLEAIYAFGIRWRRKLEDRLSRTDNSPEAIIRRNREGVQP